MIKPVVFSETCKSSLVSLSEHLEDSFKSKAAIPKMFSSNRYDLTLQFALAMSVLLVIKSWFYLRSNPLLRAHLSLRNNDLVRSKWMGSRPQVQRDDIRQESIMKILPSQSPAVIGFKMQVSQDQSRAQGWRP